MSENVHPGAHIRKLRTDRKLTLAELAARIDLTPSMLSKMERGQADPSLAALRKLAAEFGVPLFQFFVESNHREHVLHPGDRPMMRRRNAGAVYEFLHRDGTTQIEFSRVTVAPGGGTREADSHPGEEIALVISGTLHLLINDIEYTLHSDDSIQWDSTKPHRWHNPGPDDLKVLFAAAPAGTPKP